MKETKVVRFALSLALGLAICFARSAFGQSSLKILLTNDDGIAAPGLEALFDQMITIGRVTVVASTANESGASHGLTSEGPIRVEESEKNGSKWYAVEARPATCVRLALEALLPEKPDLLISGINRGDTLGVVTFYSATVACAREAAFAGVPAMAVHLGRGETMDFKGAAALVAEFVRKISLKDLKPGVFLNINIPPLPREKIRGLLATRQDLRQTVEFYDRKEDPQGRTYFMRRFKLLEPAGEDTDIWAFRNGYISITPLQFDQTDYGELKRLGSWIERMRKDPGS